mgnify:CR=1
KKYFLEAYRMVLEKVNFPHIDTIHFLGSKLAKVGKCGDVCSDECLFRRRIQIVFEFVSAVTSAVLLQRYAVQMQESYWW